MKPAVLATCAVLGITFQVPASRAQDYQGANPAMSALQASTATNNARPGESGLSPTRQSERSVSSDLTSQLSARAPRGESSDLRTRLRSE